jgi:hypothetical protein
MNVHHTLHFSLLHELANFLYVCLRPSMKVRQNPVADLDLDDAVEFLSREDVDEIRTFDLSLKCVRQEDKLRRCEEVRDKLVKNHTHIEELSAAYTAVFKTHLKSNAISGPNWDSFQTIALYGQQRLIATIAVSKRWGKTLARDYDFQSKSRTFCNLLRTVAIAYPRWEDAVELLNKCIFDRIQTKKGRKHAQEHPIQQSDLTRIIKHNVPNVTITPFEGFENDSHGLLVLVVQPQPTEVERPSSQTLSPSASPSTSQAPLQPRRDEVGTASLSPPSSILQESLQPRQNEVETALLYPPPSTLYTCPQHPQVDDETASISPPPSYTSSPQHPREDDETASLSPPSSASHTSPHRPQEDDETASLSPPSTLHPSAQAPREEEERASYPETWSLLQSLPSLSSQQSYDSDSRAESTPPSTPSCSPGSSGNPEDFVDSGNASCSHAAEKRKGCDFSLEAAKRPKTNGQVPSQCGTESLEDRLSSLFSEIIRTECIPYDRFSETVGAALHRAKPNTLALQLGATRHEPPWCANWTANANALHFPGQGYLNSSGSQSPPEEFPLPFPPLPGIQVLAGSSPSNQSVRLDTSRQATSSFLEQVLSSSPGSHEPPYGQIGTATLHVGQEQARDAHGGIYPSQAVQSLPSTSTAQPEILSTLLPGPTHIPRGPRLITIKKEFLQRIVVANIKSIVGDIWYLNTSTPPIISLRLPKDLIEGHGNGEDIVHWVPDLGDSTDWANMGVIDPTDFLELIVKDGWGRLIYNEAQGHPDPEEEGPGPEKEGHPDPEEGPKKDGSDPKKKGPIDAFLTLEILEQDLIVQLNKVVKVPTVDDYLPGSEGEY